METSALGSVIPSWGAPTLEGFDTNNIVDGQRLKGSGRQFVRFYIKKFVEVFATKVKTNEKTGATQVLETSTREREREMVEIITPGDKNIVDDFAEDFHRREHWKAYKAFRDGHGVPLGKSVDECSYISPQMATELKYRGCYTEEQLAEASDLLCQQIPNGSDLRAFARSIVKVNNEGKNTEEVSQLKQQLLQAQLAMSEMADAQAKMQEELVKLSSIKRNKKGSTEDSDS
jgi:hypothetical protein